jgi:hypothetical protein
MRRYNTGVNACPDCGFKNHPDRDSCSKCGKVFREAKDWRPLVQKIGAPIVGALLLVGLGVKIFGPSKMELKAKRFEERERQAEAKRREPEPPPVPIPAKAESTPPPARKPVEPQEPSREDRGGAWLMKGDDLYDKGDFPGAAAAYKEAEALGIWSAESRSRKKVLDDVAYIAMTRDYLDRGGIVDPSRIVSAKANLDRMNPSTLPTEAWRETHRGTLARVSKLYKEMIGDR